MSAFSIVRFAYFAQLALLLLADAFLWEVHWLAYLLPALLFTALLVLGAANMRLNFYLPAKTSLPVETKTIALTFDDGPSAAYTPAVLSLLDQYNARASFFCIGRKIAAQPALVKSMLEKGHAIGNHSYSHSNFFSLFGKKKMIAEIRETNGLIEALSGAPCTLFRPPYGVTNPPLARAVKACGMQLIGWNIRSFDTTAKDYRKVVQRVLSAIKPGAIILLHDDRENCPKILEEILRYTQENNYHYALVHELKKEKNAV